MKVRCSRNCRSIRILVTLMLFGMFIAPLWAQPSNVEEAKRMKIDSFISVAQEQIKRGFYPQAQTRLNELQTSDEYSPYLTDKQNSTISSLLKKINQATTERQQIALALQQVDILSSEGKYQAALAKLNEIKSSEYATAQEQQLIAARHAEISSVAAAEQEKWQLLYNDSVTSYNAGDAEKAREGFVQVANSGYAVQGDKTPADYIMMIDNPMETVETIMPLVDESDVGMTPVPVQEPVVETIEVMVQEPADQEIEPADMLQVTEPQPVLDTPQEQNYLQVIDAKNARLMSYTKAIVDDAQEKAQTHLNLNEFDQAKAALRRAFSTIEKNKMLLGDAQYKDYYARLSNLSQTVDEAQMAYQAKTDQAATAAADQLTEQLRETMETQRAQAIDTYMGRTYAFMDQQRYDEALGQLEQLLAIDPLNQNALVLKKNLQRMISFIEQRQVRDQANQEEIDLLIKADRQSIAYANEINFPRNWKEISERRDQALEEGLSPADLAVNRQLEKSVDLSMLTEDTTFEEAIDIIRNAVDPPLTIIVLWSDLSDNAFVDKDTAINMTGEGLNSIVLKVGLQRLLQAVSSSAVSELGYVLEDGVITIASEESLPENFKQKTYDVTDLLQQPADYNEYNQNQGMGGQGGQSGGMGGGGMGGMGGGGMGGMGGGGMGGMGGGGMGGGGGGYGGGGGGMGGGSQQGGNWQARRRGYELMYTIQETLEPDSWYDAGGEGRIEQYSESKLIVWQSPEVHQMIEEFLNELRADLGQQIAVEARFLLVDENFLEDIGMDVEIPKIKVGKTFGGDDGIISVEQDSYTHTIPTGTKITSTLGGQFADAALGTSFNLDLDDFEANFIIRATQAHRNAKTLTAPKAMVLNGESATMQVYTDQRLKTGSELNSETTTTQGIVNTVYWWDTELEDISTGVRLVITPVITADKKYVLLRITATLEELLSTAIGKSIGIVGDGTVEDEYILPTTQTSSVQTRVTVPDQGTVLMGGLTLTAENQIESGAPVLSKVPILGRFFSNRSDVRDKQILLIMVRPSIVLKDEAEEDALAALSN